MVISLYYIYKLVRENFSLQRYKPEKKPPGSFKISPDIQKKTFKVSRSIIYIFIFIYDNEMNVSKIFKRKTQISHYVSVYQM